MVVNLSSVEKEKQDLVGKNINYYSYNNQTTDLLLKTIASVYPDSYMYIHLTS